MKITLTSIMVDDQAKALDFYTEVLGFEKKVDVPVGEHRWLTVVSPADPGGAGRRAAAALLLAGLQASGSGRERSRFSACQFVAVI